MTTVQLKISNLPANMNQISLAQVFSPLEGVTSVRLFRDLNNIVTGYVDFMDRRTADLVKSVYHGWSGFGQPLHVDYNYTSLDSNKRPRDIYDSQATGPHAKQARGMDGMAYSSFGHATNGNGMMQQPTASQVSGYNSAGISGYQQSAAISSSTYNQQTLQTLPTPSPMIQAMSGYVSTPISMSGNPGMMANGGTPAPQPRPQPQQQQQQMVQMTPMQAMAANGTAMMQAAPQMAPQVPAGMVMVPAQQAAMMNAAAMAPAAAAPGMQMVMVPQAMVQQSGMMVPVGPAVPPPRPPPTVPGPRPPSSLPLPPNAVNTVYLESLPADVTKREIAHIFRQFDGYKNTRLVSKDSTKKAGDKITMAFVEFTTVLQASTAMSLLQGYVFDLDSDTGFALKISYARPHTKPTMLRKSNNANMNKAK